MFIYFLLAFHLLGASTLQETGFVEIHNPYHTEETFTDLYARFDEFIIFLQTNPVWAQKLYAAKERFIRSKERNYYSTNFFGFYDESGREGRNQIAFYYSTHFHDFILPEFKQVPEITTFLETCLQIQEPYGTLFDEAKAEINLDEPLYILFKVIKYLPSYNPTRPHYDGTAFSLFLNSTDNESLLLSSYKLSFAIEDFFSPSREPNSILLIPGTLLTEFFLFPTPHIVIQSGKTRYSTIAFAMRPHHTSQKIEFSSLPFFKH